MNYTANLTIGQELTADGSLRLSKERIAESAETSGDASIVHLDVRAARDFSFPKAMVHGLLGMTLAGRLLADHFAQHQLRQFSSRFIAMTFGDAVLRFEAVATGFRDADEGRNAEISLKVINQNDQAVMTGRRLVALVCTSFYWEIGQRRPEICCAASVVFRQFSHRSARRLEEPAGRSLLSRRGRANAAAKGSAMSEDEFEPRLGKMRSLGSKRGRKYLSQVVAAAISVRLVRRCRPMLIRPRRPPRPSGSASLPSARRRGSPA